MSSPPFRGDPNDKLENVPVFHRPFGDVSSTFRHASDRLANRWGGGAVQVFEGQNCWYRTEKLPRIVAPIPNKLPRTAVPIPINLKTLRSNFTCKKHERPV